MTDAKKAAIVTTVRLVITSTATLGSIFSYNIYTSALLDIEARELSLQTALASLWLVLLLLLCSTFFALLYYRKSYVAPPSGGYEFIEDPGFYRHIRTGGHFCNPCLSKGLASRLSIHFQDGYKCRTCGEIYVPPGSGSASFESFDPKQKEE